MTSLSNLISKLDVPDPEIKQLFTDNYKQLLLKNIDDKNLHSAKAVVEMYLKEQLGNSIINYRIYSYKTLKGINVEILIQPENSSIIMQYILELNKEKTIFRRIK